MKNRWFVSLLMVVVMMCACWTGVLAEDEERETFTSGDYEYALLDDGTIEITKYNGSADHLAIPAKLDGKTVTAIGDGAFFFCFSLTSVSIPDSVEQIGANPFRTCSALKTISVSPEHPYFATIDGVLFRKADKTLISYPAGINSSTYTIPQGITAIGDSVFSFCSSLTSVSIPDSVAAIGDRAFSDCDSLTSVSIPDSVTSIGDKAFSDCDSLTSVSIPDSVTAIGNSAFSFCDSLTSVSIPDSVTQIGVNPFVACSALKTISVSPEHPYFATIDGVLFRKADKTLISYPAGINSSTYTIPQGIASIGDSAFSSCDSLTSVSIPDSVTAIGNRAFYSCDSLTSVSIPDSVTAIGDGAFYSCDSLTSVSIPDSVEQIGANPFGNCSALKTISVSPEHPYFATIDDVLLRKADKTLISYPKGIKSSTYTIPQGIASIAYTIPQGIASIGDRAFSWCFSLTSVSIPDSVTSIGDFAFYSCDSLTSVSIPDSVTSIGDSAFSFCPNLTLTVPRNSYAAEYAKSNDIYYTYPDANDWLNN